MLCCLLADSIIFSIAQFLFLATAFIIYLHDKGYFRNTGGVKTEVTRGDESWGHFHAAFGFLSIFLLEVINTTEAWKGYKTIITFVDLLLLIYLCYFSSYFRNKIVGIFSKSKNMTEK